MRFSEHFRISRTDEDDWFDPLLTADTKLFVDPFRVWVDASEDPVWVGAHEHLLDFFNLVLELVARSGFQRTSSHWQAVSRLLRFPEPAEFCLGYAEGSTRGSGSDVGLQQGMLEGAVSGIRRGIENVDHFEELTLFEKGIGADRISDMVCNVLKERFIAYTQRVAERHGVATEAVATPNATWSREFKRWDSAVLDLPVNPENGRAVLLTPKRFLRSLPSIDPKDFWEWAWRNENERIRGEFNYDVATNIKAEEIARLARRHPDLAKEYVLALESRPKEPYDIEADEDLRVKWYEYGQEIVETVDFGAAPDREEAFCDFVGSLLATFRRYIEEEGGWDMLWAAGNPRPERTVQRLFRGILIHYCRANDIDLSGEPNAGRGPVDFKFSQGWSARALVEVKLTNNTSYWHGVKEQLPTYMRAEGIKCGYFLSVSFRKQDFAMDRRQRVRDVAKHVSEELGIRIESSFVDARRPPPASRA